MSFQDYSLKFISKAENKGLTAESIHRLLKYAEKLYSNNFPIIYNRKHLSTYIKIKNSYFDELILTPQKFYKSFKIKKKNSEDYRVINTPFPNLRFIQNWILKNILYNLQSHANATAYIKGKSLKDNLEKHIAQPIVLKLDIINFFDSIDECLVQNLFNSIGFTIELSKDFAKICCLNNSLPQGASTSAYISNLILLNFDTVISDYCIINNINYTRYADDLTFSGNLNCEDIINKVSEELKKISPQLNLNLSKKQIMYSHQKQYVTGVIVNEKIQLDKESRNYLRMISFLIDKQKFDDYVKNKLKVDKIDFIHQLLGQVNFGIFLNPDDTKLVELKKKIHNIK